MMYDFIVIGAGIAGCAAAYELAEDSKVLLIEAEQQPGYHSSGLSAALFTSNFDQQGRPQGFRSTYRCGDIDPALWLSSE